MVSFLGLRTEFPVLVCDLSTDAIIGTDTLGSILPHTLDIKNGLLFTDGGVSLQLRKSNRKVVTCGVPQGSILGPILFLMYVNDIHKCTSLDVLSFADDTTILCSSYDIKALYDEMNFELGKLSEWFKANKLCLNIKKTKYILFQPNNAHIARKSQDFDIFIDGQKVDQISHSNSDKSFKFLGLHIDETLSWRYHAQKVCAKISTSNYIINKVKNFLPKSALKSLYLSFVHSHICYGLVIWGASKLSNSVHKLQKRAIRTINHKSFNYHTDPLFKGCGILKLPDQYIHDVAVFVHNLKYGKLPKSFESLTYFVQRNQPQTRQTKKCILPTIPYHIHFPYAIASVAKDME